MRFHIKPTDRLTVLGMTGSGKSYFKKGLLDYLPRWIHYDLKGESRINPTENPLNSSETTLRDIAECKNPPHSIYVPETGSDEEFDELCRVIYNRQNTLFDVDEIGTHSRQNCPNFSKLLRLGRARGCPVWTATQNPAWCDLDILRQAEHYALFRLMLKADRDRIKGIVGYDIEELRTLPPHHFFWYSVGMEKPILCRPITRNI